MLNVIGHTRVIVWVQTLLNVGHYTNQACSARPSASGCHLRKVRLAARSHDFDVPEEKGGIATAQDEATGIQA
jgi:hypothetical protein